MFHYFFTVISGKVIYSFNGKNTSFLHRYPIILSVFTETWFILFFLYHTGKAQRFLWADLPPHSLNPAHTITFRQASGRRFPCGIFPCLLPVRKQQHHQTDHLFSFFCIFYSKQQLFQLIFTIKKSCTLKKKKKQSIFMDNKADRRKNVLRLCCG